MSMEMWGPCESSTTGESGDLYFERFINGFVAPVLERWKDMETRHSLSVVFFTRSRVHSEDKQDFDEPDKEGRNYRDFYKMVVENEEPASLESLIPTLKAEFLAFPRQVGWLKQPQARREGLPYWGGAPVYASQGNILEAINVTLNVMEKHYLDRDVSRTGNSIVVISPSPGLFRVTEDLSTITKQRMFDNGIGMDLISLSEAPLHTVPLFVHRTPYSDSEKYELPNFMDVTHLYPQASAWTGSHAARIPRPPEGSRVDLGMCIAVPLQDQPPAMPPVIRDALPSALQVILFNESLRHHNSSASLTLLDTEPAVPVPRLSSRASSSSQSINDVVGLPMSGSPTYDSPLPPPPGPSETSPEILIQKDSNDQLFPQGLPNIRPLDLKTESSSDLRAMAELDGGSSAKIRTSTASVDGIDREWEDCEFAMPLEPEPLYNDDLDDEDFEELMRIYDSRLFNSQANCMLRFPGKNMPHSRSFIDRPNPPNEGGTPMLKHKGKSSSSRLHSIKSGVSIPSSRNSVVPPSPIIPPQQSFTQLTSFGSPLAFNDTQYSRSVEMEQTHLTAKWLRPPIPQRIRSASMTDDIISFVNPFAKADVEEIKANGRFRWAQIFSLEGSMTEENTDQTGLKWKNLSSPASLPLTTEHVSVVDHTYQSLPYSLHLSQTAQYRLFLREMIMQRLTYNFQIQQDDDMPETLFGIFGKDDPCDAQCARGMLSLTMGRRLQKLKCLDGGDEVSVEEYARTDAAMGASEQAGRKYSYLVWVPTLQRFQPMTQTFFRYPVQVQWKTIDQLITGTVDRSSMCDPNTKYKRLFFTIIPPKFPLADEDTHDRHFLRQRDELHVMTEASMAARRPHARYKSRSASMPTPMQPLADPSTPSKGRNPLLLATPPVAIAATTTTTTVVPELELFGKDAMSLPPPPASSTRALGTSPSLLSTLSTPPSSVTVPATTAAQQQQHKRTSSPPPPPPPSSTSTPPTTLHSSTVLEQEPSEAVSLASFFERFGKFQAYLNSRRDPRSDDVPLAVGVLDDAGGDGENSASDVFLSVDPRKHAEGRDEWLLLAANPTLSPHRCFDLEVCWILCSGRNVHDFVQATNRRANQYGLRLAQMPAYSVDRNVSIHSFLGLPFVHVHQPALMPLLELALSRIFDFIPSSNRATDWEASFPWLDRRRGGREAVTSQKSQLHALLRTSSNNGGEPQHASFKPNPLLGRRRKDPQYVHRTGCIAVRVCPGKGFAWVTNRLRVSDLVTQSLEDKLETSDGLLRTFMRFRSTTMTIWHWAVQRAAAVPRLPRADEDSPSREDSPQDVVPGLERCELAFCVWQIMQFAFDFPVAQRP